MEFCDVCNHSSKYFFQSVSLICAITQIPIFDDYYELCFSNWNANIAGKLVFSCSISVHVPIRKFMIQLKKQFFSKRITIPGSILIIAL